jgi:hypothetical protein
VEQALPSNQIYGNPSGALAEVVEKPEQCGATMRPDQPAFQSESI